MSETRRPRRLFLLVAVAWVIAIGFILGQCALEHAEGRAGPAGARYQAAA